MNKTLFFSLFFALSYQIGFAQAPTGLNGTGYQTTVHLKWDQYTAFESVGYNIYRTTQSGVYGAPARRIGAYTDYTDYLLNPGVTLYYKIAAFDGAGNESPLSDEISVSTNHQTYRKIANLDLLIPIYTGGMSASVPDEIKQSLELARQFYFRNSFGQLNLKFHYMIIEGYPPLNANGVADFNTIGADLKAKGILDNQYDAIHIMALKLAGWQGGAQWLGQTGGSMGWNWTSFDPNDLIVRGTAWLFTHEFGHSLDGIIAGGSGYPEMIFNHFPWALPLPSPLDVFDAGPHFDGMSQVLRLFTHHLDYKAPWDGYFEVVDEDQDGLASNDARLPMDEFRFGSNPNVADTENDGLHDLAEYHASTFSSGNPNDEDTDKDGVVDGVDVYPTSNFAPINQKTNTSITIDGILTPEEGWNHLVSNPFLSKMSSMPNLKVSSTWDDDYLYFGFQGTIPLKFHLNLDGSGEDGLFASDIRWPEGNYSSTSADALGDSYYESMELTIRSDGSQVYLNNQPVAGSEVATTQVNSLYYTEVRLPHHLGPGFGYTYTPPTAPIITQQSYTTDDIIGIALTAIPLAVANGNAANDWRDKNYLMMNDTYHFYDMTLKGEGSIGGDCDAVVITGGEGQITITNLSAPNEIVEVYDENWQQVFRCQGSECGNEQTVSGLAEGTYFVKVQFYDANWQWICGLDNVEIAVGGGTGGNCEEVIITGGEGQITITNLTAANEIVEVYDENWQQIFRCQGGDCGNEQTISSLAEGTYFVKVQFYDANWQWICGLDNVETTVGGGTGGDCDAVQITPAPAQITISGLSAPNVIVDVFDSNWAGVFRCVGNECNETEIITGLNSGTYRINLQFFEADWLPICSKENIMVEVGPNGIPSCDDVIVSDDNGAIDIAGLTAPIEIVRIFDLDNGWQQVFECNNDCEDSQTVSGLTSQNYLIKVQMYTNNWGWICERNIEFSFGGGGAGSRYVAADLAKLIQEEKLLTVFPNPVQYELNLDTRFLKDKTGMIQVYNTFGQLVEEWNNQDFTTFSKTIDVGNYENGLYWLSVKVQGLPRVPKRFIVENLR